MFLLKTMVQKKVKNQCYDSFHATAENVAREEGQEVDDTANRDVASKWPSKGKSNVQTLFEQNFVASQSCRQRPMRRVRNEEFPHEILKRYTT